jgi:hypothetical protein
MGVAAWVSRRIVHADLRPSEIVMSTGSSAIRLEDYIAEGPGGRLYWRVAGAVTTLFISVGTVLLLALPWHHPAAQPGAPAWQAWTVGLPAAVAMGTLAAVLAAGVRAMHRHRADPVTDPTD